MHQQNEGRLLRVFVPAMYVTGLQRNRRCCRKSYCTGVRNRSLQQNLAFKSKTDKAVTRTLTTRTSYTSCRCCSVPNSSKTLYKRIITIIQFQVLCGRCCVEASLTNVAMSQGATWQRLPLQKANVRKPLINNVHGGKLTSVTMQKHNAS